MFEQVLEFFIAFLNDDQSLLLAIEDGNKDICIQQDKLVFSLNGLYLFLLNSQLISKQISFPEFKKMLYASRFNQELQAYNAVIEVYQSTSKVDTSLYCLSKRNNNIK